MVLAFAIALPLANTAQAATTHAPNGFYKMEIGSEYIPVTKFMFNSLQEKVALLTGNYYLILEGSAVKASDILTATTDKELESKTMTQSQLEQKFDVGIDSQGNVQESFYVTEIH